jgi:DNA modification methylase
VKTDTSEASGIPVHCRDCEIVDLADLVPYPGNPNTHSDEQVALLAKIIRARGWRHPVIVSTFSGRVVAGHGRIEAARLLGVATVPVERQAFASEAEEREFLLSDNRIAELAERDNALLKDLLEQLDTGETDMDLTGYTTEVIESLMLQEHQDGEADAEPQVDRAAELAEKWGVKSGDLWLIGEHRLLCGDSTKAEDVARCLGEAKPLLMVTDPPYGVEYDADWRNDALAGKPRADGKIVGGGRAIGKVTNDDRADWSPAWRLFPGDVAYVWHADLASWIVAESLLAERFQIRAQIVWGKNALVISQGAYHFQHEPCWYAVRKGATASWCGDRKQTTLWQIDKPQKSETGHSTQKPVECMARPMRNHNAPEVYDPFLGSGTTMVAAQNLGRRCYGIEIAPGYCGVILQRMADSFPGIEIRKSDA